MREPMRINMLKPVMQIVNLFRQLKYAGSLIGSTVLVVAISLPLASFAMSGKISDQPNIVLIMADDIGYECFGANGSEMYRTPNLDRLAQQGIRFTRCHVNPLCTPTRVEIMTGISNVRNYERFGHLSRKEKTFGNVFREAGYATGIFGKWQLGTEKDAPQHFGFDESCLWQHTRAVGKNRTSRYENPGLEINGVEHDFPGEYGPEVVNNFALDFITRHKDRPFLLYYPMIETHGPFGPTPDSPDWDPEGKGIQNEAGSQAPPGRGGNDVQNKLDKKTQYFVEMVSFMDKMAGRVISKLDELGIGKNTIVIFLGDNGTAHDITSFLHGREYPGGKGRTASNGTHVPLFIGWPDKIEPGRVSDELIGVSDFFPTICEAAGIAVPNGLDGLSFLPALLGKEYKGREWIYGWYSPRRNPDKLTVEEYVQDGAYKLYRTGEIYDVVNDPFEQTPMSENALTPDAKNHVEGLKAVLGQFKNARPEVLEKEAAARAAKSKQP